MHVDSFDAFVDDVRAVHALVRSRHQGLPVVVVGHSQGGLIVLRYVLAEPEAHACVIVSSPLIGTHPDLVPSGLLRLASRVLRRLAPRLLLSHPVEPRRVSRDPAVVEAYAADPLVSRTLSSGWHAALLEAQASVLARACEWRVPALVMAAGADLLVDTDAIRRFVGLAPPGLVDLVVWEGLYHETFNEPEKDRVFDRMEAWLMARLAGLTVPAPPT